MMSSSETLRVRVDRSMAKRVDDWARSHGTDVSGTLRTALERLLDEEDRLRRVEAARKRLQKAFELGLFDPPSDDTKAGGFR